MAYFLCVERCEQSDASFDEWVETSFRNLVAFCLRKSHDFAAAADVVNTGGDLPYSKPTLPICCDQQLDLKLLQFDGHPPAACAKALARKCVLEFEEQVKLVTSPVSHGKEIKNQTMVVAPSNEPMMARSSKMLYIGLECLFKLLSELNTKDSNALVVALVSLSQLLETFTVEELSTENLAITDKLFELLKELWGSGSNDDIVALAGSCMLSLSIAKGSLPYLLQTACCLMCASDLPEAFVMVNIPDNFRRLYCSLQKVVLTGSLRRLNNCWFDTPINDAMKTFEFKCDDAIFSYVGEIVNSVFCSVASDGQYLYIIDQKGLVKVGTGCAETKRGNIYACSGMFKATSPIALYICRGSLYLKRKNASKIWVFDTDSLLNTGEILLHPAMTDAVLCSDGQMFLKIELDQSQNLQITPLTDSFLPFTQNQLSTQKLTSACTELYVELKSVRLLCAGEHSDLLISQLLNDLKPSIREHLHDIQVGRDFAVVLNDAGKMFYCGIGSHFEMPDCYDTWNELYCPELVKCVSLGHNGLHIIAITQVGDALFFGVAQRGEDGVLQQLRKGTQTLKGKRINGSEAKVKLCASNAGSSALVTEQGELFMFGKDAAHCVTGNGRVLGLEKMIVIMVSLGKAHCAVVTKQGHLFTMGVNNFGQCGRYESGGSGKDSDSERSFKTEDSGSSSHQSPVMVCALDNHRFNPGPATVCKRCGLCSTHGANCSAKSDAKKRFLRLSLSCGGTDAVCAKCGICKICSKKSVPKDSESDTMKSNMFLPLFRVLFKPGILVSHVDCGNYHTLILTREGHLFTFGANRYGQLGLGDTRNRFSPERVTVGLPNACVVIQISAGFYHSVVRTADNMVYTCGKFHVGQLCREGRGLSWNCTLAAIDGFDENLRKRALWMSASGDFTFVRFETNILSNNLLNNCEASATSQYVMILAAKQVSAPFSYIIIDRISGESRIFRDIDRSMFRHRTFCFDSAFDVIWAFNQNDNSTSCYAQPSKYKNVIKSMPEFTTNPEFWLPAKRDCQTSPFHLALCVLTTCYQNVCIGDSSMSLLESSTSAPKTTTTQADITPDDYSVVDRFQGYGGGWGYSVQSVEAVHFMVNRDVQVIGIGLFGGRGEYWAKIKLLRLRPNDEDERNLELLSEVDDVTFECGPRERCHIFFKKPVNCKAEDWYAIWIAINGPSSDCGSNGQSIVFGEDGVIFQFRGSRLSNNGTDVGVGQIPQVLYRQQPMFTGNNGSGSLVLGSSTTGITVKQNSDASDLVEPCLINLSSKCSDNDELSQTESFVSCLKMLTYCVDRTLHLSLGGPDADWHMERFMSVALMSVRMLSHLLLELYPEKSNAALQETDEGVLFVEESFQILCNILRCDTRDSGTGTSEHLFDECVQAMVKCFHVFYPLTSFFKAHLLDLLYEAKDSSSYSWMLYAALIGLNGNIQPLLLLLGGYVPSPMKHATSLITHITSSRQYNKTAQSVDLELFLSQILDFLLQTEHKFDASDEPGNLDSKMQAVASDLLLKIIEEFLSVGSTQFGTDATTLLQAGPRFTRKSAALCWDAGNGAAEAIAFQVDVSWVTLHGFGVYLGPGNFTFAAELLVANESGSPDRWQVLDKVTGKLQSCDTNTDQIGVVKFSRPMKLIKNVSYAIRLSLHGSKTFCGESGVAIVTGVRGVRFTFQSCPLSLNGTTVTRGQLPLLLYSAKSHRSSLPIKTDEAAKWIMYCLKELVLRLLKTDRYIVSAQENEIINKSVQKLLGTIKRLIGYIEVFMSKDSQAIFLVLKTCDELLTSVVAKHRRDKIPKNTPKPISSISIIESEHPYKVGNVYSCTITFDENVSFLNLEFDPECATGQMGDHLSLYIKNDSSWICVARFGSQTEPFPSKNVLLPGRSLWFLFESSALVDKVDESLLYGFRCKVSGLVVESTDVLTEVEQEITYASAKACQYLLASAEKLPLARTLADVPSLDEDARQLFKNHGLLLSRGLHCPHNFNPAEVCRRLELAPPRQTPESIFLTNFVKATDNNTAGRLARWLMPEPYIDVEICEFMVGCDRLSSGQSVPITVIAKDQYGRIANSPSLKVDVNVLVQHHQVGSKAADAISPELEAVIQVEQYQPTYQNKARYMAITMMKKLENYSFEELRMGYLSESYSRECLPISTNEDGTYTANWVPRQSGSYKIVCFIDEFMVPKSHAIEISNGKVVKQESPQKYVRQSRLKMASCKKDWTNGIRIRTAPSLSATQIGQIPKGATIFYVEEVHNADGVWLKLSDETALQYCERITNPMGTFCLLKNAHTKRVAMERDEVSVASEPKTNVDLSDACSLSSHSVVVACEEIYLVIKCGYMGLEIKSKPTKNAKVIGLVSLSEELSSIGWLQNMEGIWIQLSKPSLTRYSFETDVVDGFCLIQYMPNSSIYLERLVTPDTSGHFGGKASENAMVISDDGYNYDLPGTSHDMGRPIATQTSPSKDKMMKNTPVSLINSKFKPMVRVPPSGSNRRNCVIVAARPSFVECVRTVFASVLWHDSLVHDAMACASYLRFHPELHCLQFRHTAATDNQPSEAAVLDMFEGFNVPIALQLIHYLWKEICSAVKAVIRQHLILPSPPLALPSLSNADGVSYGKRDETFCELCEDSFCPPVTAHMKLAHPGCSADTEGLGYNSVGKYTQGWSGNCGESGSGANTWYLICRQCRQKCLRSSKSQKDRRKRLRGRALRLSNGGGVNPQKIMKNNALFLLLLNNTDVLQKFDDGVVDAEMHAGQWNIDAFPITSPINPPDANSPLGAAKVDPLKQLDVVNLPHVSDPGPSPGRRRDDKNLSQPFSEPSDGELTQIQPEKIVAHDQSGFLISSPSVALKTAVSHRDQANVSVTLKRPVLAFIIRHHDIERIKMIIQLSIVRACAYSHAFRVLNWLLRLVTDSVSIEEILWHLISGLSAIHTKVDGVLGHPVRNTILSGQYGKQMLTDFHRVYQTVTKLLRNDQYSRNFEVQRLCLKAWCFHFTAYDHKLILTCRLLHIVNNLVFQSESLLNEPNQEMITNAVVSYDELQSLHESVTIEASSRKNMVHCLTDRNCETFWESGDEDRSKSKWISIQVHNDMARPALVAIYVDNEHDFNSRIRNVTFFSVQAASKLRQKLRSQSLPNNFRGWLKCFITNWCSKIIIELKSPEQSVRVRQVIVLGHMSYESIPQIPHSNSENIFFHALQKDVFALFQTLASYAFSESISSTEESILRQQVLDVLFSRESYQNLQEYVVAQVTTAFEKEVEKLGARDKQSYCYISGLITLLRKICVSKILDRTLSYKANILLLTSRMLLFSPPLVQVQILDLYTALFEVTNPHLIDHQTILNRLLILLAKTLCIQVKLKSKRQSVTNITVTNALVDTENQWFLATPTTAEVAKQASQLLIALAEGQFAQVRGSSEWRDVVRAHLAQTTLAPASYPAAMREPKKMLSLPSFWQCMASLTLIRSKSWLSHSPAWHTAESNKQQNDVLFCENHDDGQTHAYIFCEDCKLNLCHDCSTIFHLNRKRKGHVVTPLTTTGMIDFRDTFEVDTEMSCRFCGRIVVNELQNICDDPVCQMHYKNGCRKLLPCGHQCGGIVNEVECLPCLQCSNAPIHTKQDADDMCMICFTDLLSAAPSILLENCAHIFHFHCLRESLVKRWAGPRIAFNCIFCAICKAEVKHDSLDTWLAPLRSIYEDVIRKALMRLEYDGLANDPQIIQRGGAFYNNPQSYALERYAYYVCFKCGHAYFGGEARCELAAADFNEFNVEELLCGACSNVAQAEICSKHGADYLEYKCRYCCSIAVFFCFGTTHFCAACHDDFQRIIRLPKALLPRCPTGPRCVQKEGKECPLKVEHPTTGQEFALGCAVCRNIETF